MVWVKICGVRDLATAECVAACRPDAIGLNFYPRSPRAVSPAIAVAIVGRLPMDIEPIGVFVNMPTSQVADVVQQCALKRVQFHGDETPEQLAAFHELLPEIPVIRAWRHPDGPSSLGQYLADCAAFKVPLSAILLDAAIPGEYGGTGARLPWKELGTELAGRDLPPVILAGGLTAENVIEAVQAVRPWGVDVASGVESAPGMKDPERVARFVAAIRNSRSHTAS